MTKSSLDLAMVRNPDELSDSTSGSGSTDGGESQWVDMAYSGDVSKPGWQDYWSQLRARWHPVYLFGWMPPVNGYWNNEVQDHYVDGFREVVQEVEVLEEVGRELVVEEVDVVRDVIVEQVPYTVLHPVSYAGYKYDSSSSMHEKYSHERRRKLKSSGACACCPCCPCCTWCLCIGLLLGLLLLAAAMIPLLIHLLSKGGGKVDDKLGRVPLNITLYNNGSLTDDVTITSSRQYVSLKSQFETEMKQLLDSKLKEGLYSGSSIQSINYGNASINIQTYLYFNVFNNGIPSTRELRDTLLSLERDKNNGALGLLGTLKVYVDLIRFGGMSVENKTNTSMKPFDITHTTFSQSIKEIVSEQLQPVTEATPITENKDQLFTQDMNIFMFLIFHDSMLKDTMLTKGLVNSFSSNQTYLDFLIKLMNVKQTGPASNDEFEMFFHAYFKQNNTSNRHKARVVFEQSMSDFSAEVRKMSNLNFVMHLSRLIQYQLQNASQDTFKISNKTLIVIENQHRNLNTSDYLLFNVSSWHSYLLAMGIDNNGILKADYNGSRKGHFGQYATRDLLNLHKILHVFNNQMRSTKNANATHAIPDTENTVNTQKRPHLNSEEIVFDEYKVLWNKTKQELEQYIKNNEYLLLVNPPLVEHVQGPAKTSILWATFIPGQLTKDWLLEIVSNDMKHKVNLPFVMDSSRQKLLRLKTKSLMRSLSDESTTKKMHDIVSSKKLTRDQRTVLKVLYVFAMVRTEKGNNLERSYLIYLLDNETRGSILNNINHALFDENVSTVVISVDDKVTKQNMFNVLQLLQTWKLLQEAIAKVCKYYNVQPSFATSNRLSIWKLWYILHLLQNSPTNLELDIMTTDTLDVSSYGYKSVITSPGTTRHFLKTTSTLQSAENVKVHTLTTDTYTTSATYETSMTVDQSTAQSTNVSEHFSVERSTLCSGETSNTSQSWIMKSLNHLMHLIANENELKYKYNTFGRNVSDTHHNRSFLAFLTENLPVTEYDRMTYRIRYGQATANAQDNNVGGKLIEAEKYHFGNLIYILNKLSNGINKKDDIFTRNLTNEVDSNESVEHVKKTVDTLALILNGTSSLALYVRNCSNTSDPTSIEAFTVDRFLYILDLIRTKTLPTDSSHKPANMTLLENVLLADNKFTLWDFIFLSGMKWEYFRPESKYDTLGSNTRQLFENVYNISSFLNTYILSKQGSNQPNDLNSSNLELLNLIHQLDMIQNVTHLRSLHSDEFSNIGQSTLQRPRTLYEMAFILMILNSLPEDAFPSHWKQLLLSDGYITGKIDSIEDSIQRRNLQDIYHLIQTWTKFNKENVSEINSSDLQPRDQRNDVGSFWNLMYILHILQNRGLTEARVEVSTEETTQQTIHDQMSTASIKTTTVEFEHGMNTTYADSKYLNESLVTRSLDKDGTTFSTDAILSVSSTTVKLAETLTTTSKPIETHTVVNRSKSSTSGLDKETQTVPSSFEFETTTSLANMSVFDLKTTLLNTTSAQDTLQHTDGESIHGSRKLLLDLPYLLKLILNDKRLKEHIRNKADNTHSFQGNSYLEFIMALLLGKDDRLEHNILSQYFSDINSRKEHQTPSLFNRSFGVLPDKRWEKFNTSNLVYLMHVLSNETFVTNDTTLWGRMNKSSTLKDHDSVVHMLNYLSLTSNRTLPTYYDSGNISDIMLSKNITIDMFNTNSFLYTIRTSNLQTEKGDKRFDNRYIDSLRQLDDQIDLWNVFHASNVMKNVTLKSPEKHQWVLLQINSTEKLLLQNLPRISSLLETAFLHENITTNLSKFKNVTSEQIDILNVLSRLNMIDNTTVRNISNFIDTNDVSSSPLRRNRNFKELAYILLVLNDLAESPHLLRIKWQTVFENGIDDAINSIDDTFQRRNLNEILHLIRTFFLFKDAQKGTTSEGSVHSPENLHGDNSLWNLLYILHLVHNRKVADDTTYTAEPFNTTTTKMSKYTPSFTTIKSKTSSGKTETGHPITGSLEEFVSNTFEDVGVLKHHTTEHATHQSAESDSKMSSTEYEITYLETTTRPTRFQTLSASDKIISSSTMITSKPISHDTVYSDNGHIYNTTTIMQSMMHLLQLIINDQAVKTYMQHYTNSEQNQSFLTFIRDFLLINKNNRTLHGGLTNFSKRHTLGDEHDTLSVFNRSTDVLFNLTEYKLHLGNFIHVLHLLNDGTIYKHGNIYKTREANETDLTGDSNIVTAILNNLVSAFNGAQTTESVFNNFSHILPSWNFGKQTFDLERFTYILGDILRWASPDNRFSEPFNISLLDSTNLTDNQVDLWKLLQDSREIENEVSNGSVISRNRLILYSPFEKQVIRNVYTILSLSNTTLFENTTFEKAKYKNLTTEHLTILHFVYQLNNIGNNTLFETSNFSGFSDASNGLIQRPRNLYELVYLLLVLNDMDMLQKVKINSIFENGIDKAINDYEDPIQRRNMQDILYMIRTLVLFKNMGHNNVSVSKLFSLANEKNKSSFLNFLYILHLVQGRMLAKDYIETTTVESTISFSKFPIDYSTQINQSANSTVSKYTDTTLVSENVTVLLTIPNDLQRTTTINTSQTGEDHLYTTIDELLISTTPELLKYVTLETFKDTSIRTTDNITEAKPSQTTPYFETSPASPPGLPTTVSPIATVSIEKQTSSDSVSFKVESSPHTRTTTYFEGQTVSTNAETPLSTVDPISRLSSSENTYSTTDEGLLTTVATISILSSEGHATSTTDKGLPTTVSPISTLSSKRQVTSTTDEVLPTTVVLISTLSSEGQATSTTQGDHLTTVVHISTLSSEGKKTSTTDEGLLTTVAPMSTLSSERQATSTTQGNILTTAVPISTISSEGQATSTTQGDFLTTVAPISTLSSEGQATSTTDEGLLTTVAPISTLSSEGQATSTTQGDLLTTAVPISTLSSEGQATSTTDEGLPTTVAPIRTLSSEGQATSTTDEGLLTTVAPISTLSSEEQATSTTQGDILTTVAPTSTLSSEGQATSITQGDLLTTVAHISTLSSEGQVTSTTDKGLLTTVAPISTLSSEGQATSTTQGDILTTVAPISTLSSEGQATSTTQGDLPTTVVPISALSSEGKATSTTDEGLLTTVAPISTLSSEGQATSTTDEVLLTTVAPISTLSSEGQATSTTQGDLLTTAVSISTISSEGQATSTTQGDLLKTVVPISTLSSERQATSTTGEGLLTTVAPISPLSSKGQATSTTQGVHLTTVVPISTLSSEGQATSITQGDHLTTVSPISTLSSEGQATSTTQGNLPTTVAPISTISSEGQATYTIQGDLPTTVVPISTLSSEGQATSTTDESLLTTVVRISTLSSEGQATSTTQGDLLTTAVPISTISSEGQATSTTPGDLLMTVVPIRTLSSERQATSTTAEGLLTTDDPISTLSSKGQATSTTQGDLLTTVVPISTLSSERQATSTTDEGLLTTDDPISTLPSKGQATSTTQGDHLTTVVPISTLSGEGQATSTTQGDLFTTVSPISTLSSEGQATFTTQGDLPTTVVPISTLSSEGQATSTTDESLLTTVVRISTLSSEGQATSTTQGDLLTTAVPISTISSEGQATSTTPGDLLMTVVPISTLSSERQATSTTAEGLLTTDDPISTLSSKGQATSTTQGDLLTTVVPISTLSSERQATSTTDEGLLTTDDPISTLPSKGQATSTTQGDHLTTVVPISTLSGEGQATSTTQGDLFTTVSPISTLSSEGQATSTTQGDLPTTVAPISTISSEGQATSTTQVDLLTTVVPISTLSGEGKATSTTDEGLLTTVAPISTLSSEGQAPYTTQGDLLTTVVPLSTLSSEGQATSTTDEGLLTTVAPISTLSSEGQATSTTQGDYLTTVVPISTLSSEGQATYTTQGDLPTTVVPIRSISSEGQATSTTDEVLPTTVAPIITLSSTEQTTSTNNGGIRTTVAFSSTPYSETQNATLDSISDFSAPYLTTTSRSNVATKIPSDFQTMSGSNETTWSFKTGSPFTVDESTYMTASSEATTGVTNNRTSKVHQVIVSSTADMLDYSTSQTRSDTSETTTESTTLNSSLPDSFATTTIPIYLQTLNGTNNETTHTAPLEKTTLESMRGIYNTNVVDFIAYFMQYLHNVTALNNSVQDFKNMTNQDTDTAFLEFLRVLFLTGNDRYVNGTFSEILRDKRNREELATATVFNRSVVALSNLTEKVNFANLIYVMNLINKTSIANDGQLFRAREVNETDINYNKHILRRIIDFLWWLYNNNGSAKSKPRFDPHVLDLGNITDDRSDKNSFKNILNLLLTWTIPRDNVSKPFNTSFALPFGYGDGYYDDQNDLWDLLYVSRLTKTGMLRNLKPDERAFDTVDPKKKLMLTNLHIMLSILENNTITTNYADNVDDYKNITSEQHDLLFFINQLNMLPNRTYMESTTFRGFDNNTMTTLKRPRSLYELAYILMLLNNMQEDILRSKLNESIIFEDEIDAIINSINDLNQRRNLHDILFLIRTWTRLRDKHPSRSSYTASGNFDSQPFGDLLYMLHLLQKRKDATFSEPLDHVTDQTTRDTSLSNITPAIPSEQTTKLENIRGIYNTNANDFIAFFMQHLQNDTALLNYIEGSQHFTNRDTDKRFLEFLRVLFLNENGQAVNGSLSEFLKDRRNKTELITATEFNRNVVALSELTEKVNFANLIYVMNLINTTSIADDGKLFSAREVNETDINYNKQILRKIIDFLWWFYNNNVSTKSKTRIDSHVIHLDNITDDKSDQNSFKNILNLLLTWTIPRENVSKPFNTSFALPFGYGDGYNDDQNDLWDLLYVSRLTKTGMLRNIKPDEMAFETVDPKKKQMLTNLHIMLSILENDTITSNYADNVDDYKNITSEQHDLLFFINQLNMLPNRTYMESSTFSGFDNNNMTTLQRPRSLYELAYILMLLNNMQEDILRSKLNESFIFENEIDAIINSINDLNQRRNLHDILFLIRTWTRLRDKHPSRSSSTASGNFDSQPFGDLLYMLHLLQKRKYATFSEPLDHVTGQTTRDTSLSNTTPAIPSELTTKLENIRGIYNTNVIDFIAYFLQYLHNDKVLPNYLQDSKNLTNHETDKSFLEFLRVLFLNVNDRSVNSSFSEFLQDRGNREELARATVFNISVDNWSNLTEKVNFGNLIYVMNLINKTSIANDGKLFSARNGNETEMNDKKQILRRIIDFLWWLYNNNGSAKSKSRIDQHMLHVGNITDDSSDQNSFKNILNLLLAWSIPRDNVSKPFNTSLALPFGYVDGYYDDQNDLWDLLYVSRLTTTGMLRNLKHDESVFKTVDPNKKQMLTNLQIMLSILENDTITTNYVDNVDDYKNISTEQYELLNFINQLNLLPNRTFLESSTFSGFGDKPSLQRPRSLYEFAYIIMLLNNMQEDILRSKLNETIIFENEIDTTINTIRDLNKRKNLHDILYLIRIWSNLKDKHGSRNPSTAADSFDSRWFGDLLYMLHLIQKRKDALVLPHDELTTTQSALLTNGDITTKKMNFLQSTVMPESTLEMTKDVPRQTTSVINDSENATSEIPVIVRDIYTSTPMTTVDTGSLHLFNVTILPNASINSTQKTDLSNNSDTFTTIDPDYKYLWHLSVDDLNSLFPKGVDIKQPDEDWSDHDFSDIDENKTLTANKSSLVGRNKVTDANVALTILEKESKISSSPTTTLNPFDQSNTLHRLLKNKDDHTAKKESSNEEGSATLTYLMQLLNNTNSIDNLFNLTQNSSTLRTQLSGLIEFANKANVTSYLDKLMLNSTDENKNDNFNVLSYFLQLVDKTEGKGARLLNISEKFAPTNHSNYYGELANIIYILHSMINGTRNKNFDLLNLNNLADAKNDMYDIGHILRNVSKEFTLHYNMTAFSEKSNEYKSSFNHSKFHNKDKQFQLWLRYLIRELIHRSQGNDNKKKLFSNILSLIQNTGNSIPVSRKLYATFHILRILVNDTNAFRNNNATSDISYPEIPGQQKNVTSDHHIPTVKYMRVNLSASDVLKLGGNSLLNQLHIQNETGNHFNLFRDILSNRSGAGQMFDRDTINKLLLIDRLFQNVNLTNAINISSFYGNTSMPFNTDNNLNPTIWLYIMQMLQNTNISDTHLNNITVPEHQHIRHIYRMLKLRLMTPVSLESHVKPSSINESIESNINADQLKALHFLLNLYQNDAIRKVNITSSNEQFKYPPLPMSWNHSVSLSGDNFKSLYKSADQRIAEQMFKLIWNILFPANHYSSTPFVNQTLELYLSRMNHSDPKALNDFIKMNNITENQINLDHLIYLIKLIKYGIVLRSMPNREVAVQGDLLNNRTSLYLINLLQNKADTAFMHTPSGENETGDATMFKLFNTLQTMLKGGEAGPKNTSNAHIHWRGMSTRLQTIINRTKESAGSLFDENIFENELSPSVDLSSLSELLSMIAMLQNDSVLEDDPANSLKLNNLINNLLNDRNMVGILRLILNGENAFYGYQNNYFGGTDHMLTNNADSYSLLIKLYYIMSLIRNKAYTENITSTNSEEILSTLNQQPTINHLDIFKSYSNNTLYAYNHGGLGTIRPGLSFSEFQYLLNILMILQKSTFVDIVREQNLTLNILEQLNYDFNVTDLHLPNATRDTFVVQSLVNILQNKTDVNQSDFASDDRTITGFHYSLIEDLKTVLHGSHVEPNSADNMFISLPADQKLRVLTLLEYLYSFAIETIDNSNPFDNSGTLSYYTRLSTHIGDLLHRLYTIYQQLSTNEVHRVLHSANSSVKHWEIETSTEPIGQKIIWSVLDTLPLVVNATKHKFNNTTRTFDADAVDERLAVDVDNVINGREVTKTVADKQDTIPATVLSPTAELHMYQGDANGSEIEPIAENRVWGMVEPNKPLTLVWIFKHIVDWEEIKVERTFSDGRVEHIGTVHAQERVATGSTGQLQISNMSQFGGSEVRVVVAMMLFTCEDEASYNLNLTFASGGMMWRQDQIFVYGHAIPRLVAPPDIFEEDSLAGVTCHAHLGYPERQMVFRIKFKTSDSPVLLEVPPHMYEVTSPVPCEREVMASLKDVLDPGTDIDGAVVQCGLIEAPGLRPGPPPPQGHEVFSNPRAIRVIPDSVCEGGVVRLPNPFSRCDFIDCQYKMTMICPENTCFNADMGYCLADTAIDIFDNVINGREVTKTVADKQDTIPATVISPTAELHMYQGDANGSEIEPIAENRVWGMVEPNKPLTLVWIFKHIAGWEEIQVERTFSDGRVEHIGTVHAQERVATGSTGPLQISNMSQFENSEVRVVVAMTLFTCEDEASYDLNLTFASGGMMWRQDQIFVYGHAIPRLVAPPDIFEEDSLAGVTCHAHLGYPERQMVFRIQFKTSVSPVLLEVPPHKYEVTSPVPCEREVMASLKDVLDPGTDIDGAVVQCGLIEAPGLRPGPPPPQGHEVFSNPRAIRVIPDSVCEGGLVRLPNPFSRCDFIDCQYKMTMICPENTCFNADMGYCLADTA